MTQQKLTGRTLESKVAYWRRAWQAACERERDCQGQIKSLKEERNAARAERDRYIKEAKNLRGKLTSAEANGKENARLAELFRSHLDDNASDMEWDNEWEQEARQLTFNEVDAEVQREFAAEDIDE